MSAVAIVQTAFIGDVVLATPLFEASRTARPSDRIIGVVRAGCDNLLGNNPFVDEVIVWDNGEYFPLNEGQQPSDRREAEKFIKDAKNAGIVQVKGYRTVGGIRLSAYNAVSLQDVQTTIQFMDEFRKSNG